MKKPNTNGAPRRTLSRMWYWMPMLVFFIGMFSIGLLLGVEHINEKQWIHSLISSAVMDIEIHAASAHIPLEENVRERRGGDEALTHLDKALALADVILSGGETAHGLMPDALRDPKLLPQVQTIRSELARLKTLAVAALDNTGNGGDPEAPYLQFEENLRQLLDQGDALDEYLGKVSKEERRKVGTRIDGIIFVWACIVLIATVGLFNRERRRRNAENGLLKAHEHVMSLAEELAGHREHLAELVETRTAELSAANELLKQEVARRGRIEDEVRRLNDDLEKMVVERTKQLVEAQEELVRREKYNILGQLAANVGNELRNPLGVMTNGVFFLKMLLSEADETVKEYLEIIEQEIENSRWIITDFLNFAQTKPPQLQLVSVRALIAEGIDRCAIPAIVELRDEVGANLPPLNVDPTQLAQVLQNLIMNGVQAMPAGGVLTLRGNEDTSGAMRLEVADTGEGISPENMKRLFQPLFSTKSRGIGLGLVVCRNLVEANGGRIEVASEPGRGTTFTVVLPGAKD